jgi:hypothetical protein
MATFLVLYRAPVAAREQMANVTPEQAQAGMDLWRAWAASAGDAQGQVEVHEALPVPGT